MNSYWDISKIHSERLLGVSIAKRMTTGPLLGLCGHRETANGITDRPTLEGYSEVGIAGINGAPATYILTQSLLDYPQVFLGYQETGFPILVGIKKSLEGLMTILGPPRVGKSTMLASIFYQVLRLGYPAILIGMKAIDPIILASMKAGAESMTRRDSQGNRAAGEFSLVTHQPNIPTKGFNYMLQSAPDLAAWLVASGMLHGLGFGGTQKDPVQHYFIAAAQKLFQKVPRGKSWEEFLANLSAIKQDRDTRYSTAGARHEVEQQAAIEHANLPEGHPANIDLAHVIRNGGGLYIDCCYQDVGEVAIPTGGLAAQASIFAKRRLNWGRDSHMFLGIDEAQLFPHSLLKQNVEQCAGSGIRLITAYHNLSQFGDDWESISMAQVRVIFGAVPGCLTDRHLQCLFGTKKEYQMHFESSESVSFHASSTSGATGMSDTGGCTHTDTEGFGFTEQETNVWKQNDTLELNYDRDRFVIQILPGAELAYFGPKPILGKRHGLHLDGYDEVARHTNEYLKNTENKFLPAPKKTVAHSGPELSPALQERRRVCLHALTLAAARVRERILV